MGEENDCWWSAPPERDLTRRPAYQLKAQIDGVLRFLELEPRSRVLDLACGSGKQTLEIARRGHRVLGMDSLEAPLNEARAAAKAEKLTAHFLKGDIRQLGYRSEFDAVVILHSAFGRFPSERDDQRTLESVARGLKPGAKLLMDLLNKEWLMRRFQPNIWEQAEGAKGSVVLDQIRFDLELGRLDNHRTVLKADGSRTPELVSLRVYTLTEMKKLLEAAGLAYRRSWGGFDGSAYAIDSPRMLVLADKPAASQRPAPVERGVSAAIRIKGRSKRR